MAVPHRCDLFPGWSGDEHRPGNYHSLAATGPRLLIPRCSQEVDMAETLDLTFKVRRFDPDSGAATHWDDFPVKIPDHYTILDTLIDIREYHDSTLALRCSCRSAICGSC